MLDGLNGLSDMVTSVVTMISTLYAGKRTDREHPFGYGRLEYITSMFTTVFILIMGAYAIYDTVRELVSKSGSAPDYNTATIVLMCISLAAKSIYSFLARKTGKRVNSVALVMIGTETLGECMKKLLGRKSDPESLEIWDRVLDVVRAHPELVRVSAFSYDQEEKTAFRTRYRYRIIKEDYRKWKTVLSRSAGKSAAADAR